MPLYSVERPWERIVPLFLLAGTGLLIMLWVDNVVPALGHGIPEDDVATDYKVAFVWAIALWLVLLAWPLRSSDKRALVHIWLIKVAVSLGAMLFVENHYEGVDAFMYFGLPRRYDFQWPGFAFGEGTANVLSLSWLHQQILPNSYHAVKISFAMVGLVAIYLFYRTAVRCVDREDVRVLYLLALCPSILYWSSIFGKDPVILLGIALYVYGVVGIYTHSRVDLKGLAFAITLMAGVALASLFRVWLGPILLAPLVVFALFAVRHTVARVFMVIVVAWAFTQAIAKSGDLVAEKVGEQTGGATNIATTADLVETIDHIAHSGALGSASEGGSSQAVARFHNVWSMAKFAPLGAFTALFRPLPGEVLNPFGLLAGLENVVLLALVVRAMRRATWTEVRQPLILWVITLLVVWSVIYGFASTQNLGAAVRWKLQVLPLLLGLVCYLGRRRSGQGGNALIRPSHR